MKKLFLVAITFFACTGVADIQATQVATSTTSIRESEASDDYIGDVYAQNAEGTRKLARVYRSNGRLYCFFPQVVQRGSNNSGSTQKFWASRSTRRGFQYEVYYRGENWYFNI